MFGLRNVRIQRAERSSLLRTDITDQFPDCTAFISKISHGESERWP